MVQNSNNIAEVVIYKHKNYWMHEVNITDIRKKEKLHEFALCTKIDECLIFPFVLITFIHHN